MRLRSIGHYAGGLAVFVGYADGVRWGEEIRLTETQDTLTLTGALNQLWARRPSGLRRRKPMQVGVVLNRLLPMSGHTPDLFAQEQETARERLHHAMDTLNQTFGNGSVFYGGAFGVMDNAPMRIAFTRIPTPEIEQIDPRREGRLRGKRPEARGQMPEE